MDYIDAIITTGRRLSVKIIFSTHLMTGYTYRHVMNEARFVFMFPTANSNRVKNDLRLKFNFTTQQRNIILDNVKKDKSRYLGLHLASPNSYFTSKRVILF